jgi:cytochrome c556
MKRLIVMAAALSVAMLGQDEEMFSKFMKPLPPQMKKFNAALEAKDKAEMLATGNLLKDSYTKSKEYFAGKSVATGVAHAEKGLVAVNAMLASLAADNMDKAVTDGNAVKGTCKPCHDQHRERTPDGKYKIKL